MEKAQNARIEYLAQYQLGKKIDPWKDQGYKTVDLDKDVEIMDDLPVLNFHGTYKSIFVVNSYSEGLGQVFRKFLTLCGTQETAQEKLTEVQKESLDDFPEFFKAEEIFLDKLYPDDNLQDGYWWK